MGTFCIDTITPEPGLRAEHGVLRLTALAVTSDARLAADRIVQHARGEADALLQQARDDAQRLQQELERQTLERADQLLQALERANETLLLRAEDTIISLAQALFDHLVLSATPREQIEAALRRVLSEAPSKLVNPLLRVHPEDAGLLPAVDWETKPDPSLPRGVCRLEATDGEWRAEFSAAAEAVKAAFAKAVTESNANPEPA